MLSEKDERDKQEINKITLQMIFAATLGTAAAAGVAFIVRKAGIGEINPELLFMPWGVVLVAGVSLAFRRGVQVERGRHGDEHNEELQQ